MKLTSIILIIIATAFVLSSLPADAKNTKKSDGYLVAARYFASDQEQFPRPKKVAKLKKKSTKTKKKKIH